MYSLVSRHGNITTAYKSKENSICIVSVLIFNLFCIFDKMQMRFKLVLLKCLVLLHDLFTMYTFSVPLYSEINEINALWLLGDMGKQN